MHVLCPLGRLRVWGRGQNATLSEYGHVAHQINMKEAYSIKVANILPVDPLPPKKI